MTDMVYALVAGHNLEATKLLNQGPDVPRFQESSLFSEIAEKAYDSIRRVIGGSIGFFVDDSRRTLAQVSTLGDGIEERAIQEEFRMRDLQHEKKCCPKRYGANVSYDGFKGGWASYHPRIGSEVGKTKKRVRTPQKYHLCGVVGKKRYHKRNK